MFQHELKNAYIGEYRVPPSSLTAWYKLEGDTKDYSGNNRDASGSVTYGTSGSLTYAIFNGSSNYLLADNGLTSSDYTVSVWLKTSQTSTAELVITNGSGHNMQSVLLDYANSKLCPAQFYWIGSSNGFHTTTNIGDGIRHNVISIRSGTTGYVYVDGVQAGTGTVTNTLRTEQWSIGCQKFSNSRWYNGMLSNVMIDQSARTAEEVANYYNSTKSTYGL